jgi:hypothetical protein
MTTMRTPATIAKNLLAMLALAGMLGLVGCPGSGTTPAPNGGKRSPPATDPHTKAAPGNGGKATQPNPAPKPKPDADPNPERDTGGQSSPPPTVVEPFPETPADQRVTFDNGVVAHLGQDPRVEAEVILLSGQGRPLEYLVVTESGNHHEALLKLMGTAGDLKQAIELLGLREGETKLRYRGDPRVPQGAKVRLDVRWLSQTRELVEQPVEDWVWWAKTGHSMTRGPWIFTGSISQFREDLNVDILQADAGGNVVAIFRDPACLIDNPRPEGTDEMYWYVNRAARLPRPGTPITLIIRPYPSE